MKASRIAMNVLIMACLSLVGTASADESNKQGYWTDTWLNVVRSGFDLCWRTEYWVLADAIAECHPDLLEATGAGMEEVAEAEVPAAAPVMQEKPVSTIVTMEAVTLFDFDSSTIHSAGKKKLDDEVVAKMKEYPQIEIIQVTGHADRIGSETYNLKLSQRRADAVKYYLVGENVETGRIRTVAKGESEPIVPCDDVKGEESGKNRALVECLQPNRRSMVKIILQKSLQK